MRGRSFRTLIITALLLAPLSGLGQGDSWLALNEGGIAVGHPQGKNGEGRLRNASLLPESGPGFLRQGGAEVNWGAGHLISLLTKAAKFFSEDHPGHRIVIGGISRKEGGRFAPHKSHQNGLDADLLFMGRNDWSSVLEKDGKVSPRFDTERNWDFWMLLMNQKLILGGREESVVSMILVSPEIKSHLCDWASRKGLSRDPAAQDLLSRIHPTPGHDGHFHLRIRCSPFHKDCVDSFYRPRGPACPSLSWRGARKSLS